MSSEALNKMIEETLAELSNADSGATCEDITEVDLDLDGALASSLEATREEVAHDAAPRWEMTTEEELFANAFAPSHQPLRWVYAIARWATILASASAVRMELVRSLLLELSWRLVLRLGNSRPARVPRAASKVVGIDTGSQHLRSRGTSTSVRLAVDR